MKENVCYVSSEPNLDSFEYVYKDIDTFRDFLSMVAFCPNGDYIAMNVGQLKKIIGFTNGDRIIDKNH